METVNSSIRLDEFNGCPGALEITKSLINLGLDWKAVDCPQKGYWQNSHDTLVIWVKGGVSEFYDGLRLMEQAHVWNPDEIDWIPNNERPNSAVIRFWWD